MHLEPARVEVDKIFVDPNNPRFFDFDDWGGQVAETLFEDAEVQSKAVERTKRLQTGGTRELEESIRANGFIPAEQIVVKPYTAGTMEDCYVVVEGNRRLTAIKSLLAESPLTEEDKLRKEELAVIQVLIYQPTGDDAEDRKNEKILQGMRHVSGPREWGAYQKGDLVVSLHDEHGMDFSAIDARIGLGPRVTKRYYHAYKALMQMKNDDDWKSDWAPSLWVLFEEALAKPTIREWLGWDEASRTFTNQQHREVFYALITGDGEEDSEPRISSPDHMRKLKKLMDARSPYLEQFLSEVVPSIDVAYAKYEADVAQAEVNLPESASRFRDLVSSLPATALKEMSDADASGLLEVVAAIEEAMANRNALKAAAS